MKKTIFLMLSLLIVGCRPSIEQNQEGISNAYPVGEINGRWTYCANVNNDKVYFFRDGTNQPITSVQTAGKTTKTVVIIDGKEYIPKED